MFLFKPVPICEFGWNELNEPSVKMTHFSNIFTSTCIKAAEMGSKMFHFQVEVFLRIERRRIE